MRTFFHYEAYPELSEEAFRLADLKGASYHTHLNAIADFSLQWFPYLNKEFLKNGRESEIVISNDKILQAKWAKENDVQFSENWYEDIVEAQIAKYRPDIYVFAGSFNYYKNFFKKIRPRVGKIVCWLSADFPRSLDLSHVDLMLSGNEKVLSFARSQNVGAAKMMGAIPQEAMDFAKPHENREHDMVFTGSLGRKFRKRRALLKDLAKKDLAFELYGLGLGEDSFLTLPVELLVKYFSRPSYNALCKRGILPLYNPLKSLVKPPVFGQSMLEKLGDTRMVLNMHSDFDIDSTINMRVFEAMIVKSLLFTEKNSGLKGVFRDEEDCIVYDSAKDFFMKLDYIRSQPYLAEEIALRGRERVLSNHTVSKRFPQFLDLIL